MKTYFVYLVIIMLGGDYFYYNSISGDDVHNGMTVIAMVPATIVFSFILIQLRLVTEDTKVIDRKVSNFLIYLYTIIQSSIIFILTFEYRVFENGITGALIFSIVHLIYCGLVLELSQYVTYERKKGNL